MQKGSGVEERTSKPMTRYDQRGEQFRVQIHDSDYFEYQQINEGAKIAEFQMSEFKSISTMHKNIYIKKI